VISGELELLQSDDPTQADLDSIGRGIGEAGRKIGNLTRALAMFGDPEAAAPIVAEIEALGVEVRVWKADHEPRYVITAQLDLEALPKAELEGQPESDLASAPGYMMRPRRQARSGCW
jgi:hypothetical protein